MDWATTYMNYAKLHPGVLVMIGFIVMAGLLFFQGYVQNKIGELGVHEANEEKQIIVNPKVEAKFSFSSGTQMFSNTFGFGPSPCDLHMANSTPVFIGCPR